jgi:ribosomal protein S7
MDSNNLSRINTDLYKKFLGFLTKKGNICKAKRILDLTFSIVSKKTKSSTHAALVTLFCKLNSFVEVKKVRVRRRFVLVPFPICAKRRSYLIVKWIMQATKKVKRKRPFSEKLSRELINILKGSPCLTKRFRQLNFSAALANRSNTHFRW